MARAVKAEEPVAFDCLPGQPHPRDVFSLLGQDKALAVAARAIRSGRPPQGWLLSGPPGVGKATLAYRLARYLLKYGASDQGPADLSVAPNDPVSQQITAGAHPGLLVLRRGANPDTGKPMTVLSVAEIRRLSNFFGLTSGAGGWRVAIIDSADEMNDNAANALLKNLEEPPPRAVLILISHAAGRLLPTIRSRCQRLVLEPLPGAMLESELAARLPDLDAAGRAALAQLADGSLGLALALAGDDGLALAREAESLIEHADLPDVLALVALGERVAKLKDGLEQFGETLTLTLSGRIRARADQGAAGLKPWLEAWERLGGLFGRASALHLEPRQTILSAARTLEGPAKRQRL